ncbi:glycosyltransferase family 1 protein [Oceanobacillus halophilus]|uniref:Glycosyltransferase family 1 protein n=1 Tax=Oceanobacillus halophilus TaxID=930130 RepID=A0A495A1Y9_9BACI|nr:glycosyltransferase family 1 protein [Oceanobacillus halophilus]RKQ33495.1 glycosyltransferase family 1 protein [Oceanobacillus halophilus]
MESAKKLKVLQVVGAMNRAGTETMLMNIYRKIDHEKVHFDFVSYSNEEADYDKEIEKLGGDIIRLQRSNSVLELYQVIKKHGPYDAIHAHTLFHCGISMVAAYLAGVKVRISHAHTTLDNSEGVVRRLYLNVMRYFINRLSTNYLACSKEAGRYLFGIGTLNKSKYSFFPNVVDYQRFIHRPTRNVNEFSLEQGIGKNDVVIGHIGRFIEAKNHKFLLQILKNIVQEKVNIRLLLVGDGDLREDIETMVETEGLKDVVHFAGLREDIPTMLHSMDVFVFPSIYEGLGLVLLEAQACGIPCIVSEAIQPEADLNIGLISKLSLADNPNIWANKILEKATYKESDTKKIASGFERNGYSLNQAVRKLMKMYKDDEADTNGKYVDRFV